MPISEKKTGLPAKKRAPVFLFPKSIWNKFKFQTTLYIDRWEEHTPKGDIKKILLYVTRYFPKKKPPVRDKSKIPQTQIRKGGFL